MSRRFIHICGGSGVGKKTLVKKLVDGAVPGLRQRFGIDGPFKAYGDIDYPGVNPMYTYAHAGEPIVVHFWQFATHGWIAHHKLAHPDDEQRVYLLWRPYESHAGDLVARDRKTSNPDGEECRRMVPQVKYVWRTQTVPLFRQIESWGLNVEVVDASTECYDLLPDWPA